MEALPEFELMRPVSLDELEGLRAAHPDSALIGGGTDLMVNMRRGIVAPKRLIDINRVAEMKEVAADGEGLSIGASVTLAEIAAHPEILRLYPALAEAAREIAGPVQRNMGTLGGNLCLDTRCIFYNQSDWWRTANNHCLKTTGEMCHVAPKSRGICFATYSGDLAPALLVHDARVEIAGPAGRRTVPLDDLYTGYARHENPEAGDGKHFLSLAPGEFVVRVTAPKPGGLRSAYDKIRVRRSIEYPVAGAAVALRMEGDTVTDLRVAITGTNPRPVLLSGTDELHGPLDEDFFEALDRLVRDQVMSMKTTFTPGHYRRKMAGVLAARLVRRLAG